MAETGGLFPVYCIFGYMTMINDWFTSTHALREGDSSIYK